MPILRSFCNVRAVASSCKCWSNHTVLTLTVMDTQLSPTDMDVVLSYLDWRVNNSELWKICEPQPCQCLILCWPEHMSPSDAGVTGFQESRTAGHIAGSTQTSVWAWECQTDWQNHPTQKWCSRIKIESDKDEIQLIIELLWDYICIHTLKTIGTRVCQLCSYQQVLSLTWAQAHGEQS